MKPFSTIKSLREAIDSGSISKAEVIKFYKQRMEKYNPQLNAMLEIFPEEPVTFNDGPLSGIPGVLKDNICQHGKTASAGSKILGNHVPSYNSTIKKRLEGAGGVVLGRTNMDEFAMGTSGEFSAFGDTKNPWDLKRAPGGSSSGSASAVAAGLVPWAIGTETGGSVRQPASFCSLVGMYPTYGLFSRYGLIAFGSSLDQPGPLTRTVYDNAMVASVMSGHDPLDSTSLPEPKKDFTKNLDGHLPEGITLGVIKDAIESDGVLPEVKELFMKSIAELEAMGAKIKYIDLPDLKYGNSVYFIISRAEAASNLSRFDGSVYGCRSSQSSSLKEMEFNTRTEGFGPEVKRRILMGNYVLSSSHRGAFYEKASHVRSMIRAEFEEAFCNVDLLISPTTTTLPFVLGEKIDDPLAMYMADYFTVPNCVAGLPALSLPSGFSKNVPVGFQFIGPRLSEELIFKVAHAYECHTECTKQTPKGYE
jgi:aspartyl-tRNA(Asn)/glutamyl-tRNA(Gln) amidotransferase subunit A